MSELQPPPWWRPPPEAYERSRGAMPPERPHYREPRPVRPAAVLAGVIASVCWYVLIGFAAWSATSFVVCMTVGMVLAGLALWLLTWRGDPGIGIGVGMMIGFALASTVLVLTWYGLIQPIVTG